jgi:hypothetical protein
MEFVCTHLLNRLVSSGDSSTAQNLNSLASMFTQPGADFGFIFLRKSVTVWSGIEPNSNLGISVERRAESDEEFIKKLCTKDLQISMSMNLNLFKIDEKKFEKA